MNREDVPGSFPILDFARHAELGVKPKVASKLTIGEAPLSGIINWDQEVSVPEQHKLDLLAVTYHLLGQFSELYKGLDAFIELFGPVTEIADRLKVGKLSEDLQVRLLHSLVSVVAARRGRRRCPFTGELRANCTNAGPVTSIEAA